VEQWKALQGPEKEVIFLQQHQAGVLGISDFTELKGEPITIGGAVLEHRFFHFRLPFSGWCHTEVVHGGRELRGALRGAAECPGGLWRGAGRAPQRQPERLFSHRNGNYSADLTCRYNELCSHLGLIPTRNNKGVAHENGPIEGPHAHFKKRLEQQLLLRGSRDFDSEEEYRALVAKVAATLNNRPAVRQKLAIERQQLKPLPVYRYRTTRRRWPRCVAPARSRCARSPTACRHG
jgi:hypothetical protein